MAGTVHLAAWLVVGGTWQGSVSFRKPTTFGLSFGLTIITLAWATGWLRVSGRARWLLARRDRYRPESAGPYNQDS